MLMEYHMGFKDYNELTDEEMLLILIKRKERITGFRLEPELPKGPYTKEDLYAAMGIVDGD